MADPLPDQGTAPLRERVANALAHNDACGPGPVTWGEYLADADALLELIAADLGLVGAVAECDRLRAENEALKAERDQMYHAILEHSVNVANGVEYGDAAAALYAALPSDEEEHRDGQ